MNRYVIDTQILVRHIFGDEPVFNPSVDKVLLDADRGKGLIIISAVVGFEIAYLHEKGRIPISARDLNELISGAANYIEEPVTMDIIEAAFEISDIPELHDRLIAGTAKYLNSPILTNDQVIRKSRFISCL